MKQESLSAQAAGPGFTDLRDAIVTADFAQMEVDRISKAVIVPGTVVFWRHGRQTRYAQVISNHGTRLRVTAQSIAGYQYVDVRRIRSLEAPAASGKESETR